MSIPPKSICYQYEKELLKSGAKVRLFGEKDKLVLGARSWELEVKRGELGMSNYPVVLECSRMAPNSYLLASTS